MFVVVVFLRTMCMYATKMKKKKNFMQKMIKLKKKMHNNPSLFKKKTEIKKNLQSIIISDYRWKINRCMNCMYMHNIIEISWALTNFNQRQSYNNQSDSCVPVQIRCRQPFHFNLKLCGGNDWLVELTLIF